MRRLDRMTLQMPEMDSESQIALTCVSLTSFRPQELLIGQLFAQCTRVRVKTDIKRNFVCESA